MQVTPQPLQRPPPPLSLYVHIPWCVRKCPYCDFNSHESKEIPEQAYVEALIQDLEQDVAAMPARPLQSIFFGGGTPSLFTPASIATVLDAAQRLIGFAPAIEITLEANPGTAEYCDLSGLRSAGVNRLSFGVQSFDDPHLQKLGRIHGGEEAITAYGKARTAGFDNINLDLMHGLPGQTLEEACSDIRQALELGPEHISWYQLTIEPNTVFYNRPPQLPEDNALADIQDEGHALLTAAGFGHYEISAYNRPNRASAHNLNYWQFGDYLAIGAGAHGKSTGADGGIERFRKTRAPADYLAADKPFLAGAKKVPPEQQMLEFMMNALRLVRGVPRELFAQRTQLEDDNLNRHVQTLVELGLLEPDPTRLQPTARGLRFLNDTLSVFA